MAMTKTSTLLRLFIRALLIPVNVDKDGKVVCKILSWRTSLHFIIIVLPTATLFVALMLLMPELSMLNFEIGQSSYEIVSNNITFIISNLGILFPIILGKGLNNMTHHSLLRNDHSWPKGGWKNIAGKETELNTIYKIKMRFTAILFLMVGSAISMQAFMPVKMSMEKVFGSHILMQGVVIFQTIPWIVPPLAVEILLQDFTNHCENMINVFDHGNDILEGYENMEMSFGTFFLVFYSWVQVFSIYNTWQLLMFVFKGNLSFVTIFGLVLMILSLVLIIVKLANSVSNANNCAKALKKIIQDELSYEENKVKSL